MISFDFHFTTQESLSLFSSRRSSLFWKTLKGIFLYKHIKMTPHFFGITIKKRSNKTTIWLGLDSNSNESALKKNKERKKKRFQSLSFFIRLIFPPFRRVAFSYFIIWPISSINFLQSVNWYNMVKPKHTHMVLVILIRELWMKYQNGVKTSVSTQKVSSLFNEFSRVIS